MNRYEVICLAIRGRLAAWIGRAVLIAVLVAMPTGCAGAGSPSSTQSSLLDIAGATSIDCAEHPNSGALPSEAECAIVANAAASMIETEVGFAREAKSTFPNAVATICLAGVAGSWECSIFLEHLDEMWLVVSASGGPVPFEEGMDTSVELSQYHTANGPEELRQLLSELELQPHEY